MRIIFLKGVYELPDDPGEEAEEGGHVEDEVEEEGRHVEGWIHPVPGKLVLQLLQEETLPGARLGVHPHRDGVGVEREGSVLCEDVRQDTAVEVVGRRFVTARPGSIASF